MANDDIFDTGISVVYQPGDLPAAVDIVFVHGLQGHPYKTWSTAKHAKKSALAQISNGQSQEPRSRKRNLRDFFHRGRTTNRNQTQPKERILEDNEPAVSTEVPLIIITQNDGENDREPSKHPSMVFWPRDLLPKACPTARMLVYGYDTKVTKYMMGPANKNNIFLHAKDLLFALQRGRPIGRPIVFVAHSLGGIVLKEMLSISSISSEADLKDIVQSTKAILFLGTPHRGSQELVGVANVARKVASIFMMDNSPAILDALGLRTSDLQRSQESFSRLWAAYGFRVKSFQEGLGLTGISLGMLSTKVVPEMSSLLGDPRERAETLEANHMDMCRFASERDPNYWKIAGELRAIYQTLEPTRGDPSTQTGDNNLPGAQYLATTKPTFTSTFRRRTAEQLDPLQKDLLRSLHFPTMEFREQTVDLPVKQTARWLFRHELYEGWWKRREVNKNSGLLWIKGKPGSGKSTLMKAALRQISLDKRPNDIVAGFFFNGKGEDLEKSPAGLFRSLLYQLLPQYPANMKDMALAYQNKHPHSANHENGMQWLRGELKSALEALLMQPSAHRTLIFVDALDECDEDSGREVAQFFRQLTISAHDEQVQLDICLSSRHYPNVSFSNCPEIIVENHNIPDIQLYVQGKLATGRDTDSTRWDSLKTNVVERSSGTFLWVVLVVDLLLRSWDKGKNMTYLENELNRVPRPLEDLFTQLLKSEDAEELSATVYLFQWVIFAARPLRLREWHHILAFARSSPPSLSAWRASIYYTEDDEQLEKQIQDISKGLVEVAGVNDTESADQNFDTESIHAGAGSLVSNQGETRYVQVIHESVREFFLNNDGFSALDPLLSSHPVGRGHLAIFQTCLAYLHITELDALVLARVQAYKAEKSKRNRADSRGRLFAPANVPRAVGLPQEDLEALRVDYFSGRKLRRSSSVSSFGSAASSYDSPKHGLSRPVSPVISRAPSLDDMLRKVSVDDSEAFRDEAICRLVEEQTWDDVALCSASAAPSIAGRSQTLEDFPALLAYATVMLFSHAKLAGDGGVNQRELVLPLLEGKSWTRWLVLRELEGVMLDATLLYYVVEKNFDWWIPFLMDPRIVADCHDQLRETLTHAIDQHNMRVIQTLLYQYHALDVLEVPRKREFLELLDILIQKGMRDEYWRMTQHAINPGLRSLWDFGDRHLRTCLHRAVVVGGDHRLVQVFIGLGSDVNSIDVFGMTPLHMACWLGEACIEIIYFLLKCGASVHARDFDGRAALDFACRSPMISARVVKKLLKYGADANAVAKGGETPLHLRSTLGAPEVVELLLKAGADIHRCDNSGLTPLDVARCPGFRTSLDLMLASRWKLGRKELAKLTDTA